MQKLKLFLTAVLVSIIISSCSYMDKSDTINRKRFEHLEQMVEDSNYTVQYKIDSVPNIPSTACYVTSKDLEKITYIKAHNKVHPLTMIIFFIVFLLIGYLIGLSDQ